MTQVVSKEMEVSNYYDGGFSSALLAFTSSVQDFDLRDWNHLWPAITCALFALLSYILLTRKAGVSTSTIAMGDSNGIVDTPPAVPATTDSSAPGDIKVSKDLPTKKELERCADLPVLDLHNKPHTFKSLYSGERAARRVLVLFIRHFFCGVSNTEVEKMAKSLADK